MDASCTFTCCGHEEEKEDDKAVIVKFSNGNLKHAELLGFTFYKNTDESNPRKKSRRMLVAESDRLSYVGNNFGTGSLKCNSLCKYFVGVLDKQTMQMEIHSAQLFNMQPVIPGEITETDASVNTSRSYREKVDSLIEAFGTNKQKRALTSRRLNQVDSESLQEAVAKAADTVIQQKGLEGLQQEVAETESQADVALYLPPCHPDADTPENVYLFHDLLTPVEYGALEEAGSKMAALTPEELQNMRDERYLCVASQLECVPSAGEAREKRVRCAYYLRLLLELTRTKNVYRSFKPEDGCPNVIRHKLLRTFTVEAFQNGRLQNIVSTSMLVKIAAHCMALLLHMGHMTVDLTLLHRDLGIPEARIMEVAKSMGLTLSKPTREKGDDPASTGDHRMAGLVLPLVKHERRMETRKRKKMR